MAHPFFHSMSTKRQFGGTVADYYDLHHWFDTSKAHDAHVRHRLVLHHDFGVHLAEHIFGSHIGENNVPVKEIGNQHVREDFGKSVKLADLMTGDNPWLTLPRPPMQPHQILVRFPDVLKSGKVSDYVNFKVFFEMPYSFLCDTSGVRQKDEWYSATALLANSFGVFLCEQMHGPMWQCPSNGRLFPTRFVAERFVKELWNGRIPSLATLLQKIQPRPELYINAASLDKQFGIDNTRTQADILRNPIVRNVYLKDIENAI